MSAGQTSVKHLHLKPSGALRVLLVLQGHFFSQQTPMIQQSLDIGLLYSCTHSQIQMLRWLKQLPFPTPNSDVHAIHLMCRWTTIIRGKDIKWKKVGERQTDKLISGVRASAPLRSTFDLVCLTHVRSIHAYVHIALSVCIHLKPYTIIRQSTCNWISSTHLTLIHWPPIRSNMKNTEFFNTKINVNNI